METDDDGNIVREAEGVVSLPMRDGNFNRRRMLSKVFKLLAYL